ncbi:MAG: c-type cytochrome domain-containing protein [Pirellulales bacterium]
MPRLPRLLFMMFKGARLPRARAWGLLTALAALPAAAEEQATFVDNALPVLRQRCGTCHNADKKTGGLDVTSYAAIMRGGGSGEVITPGDAASSYLFRVVNHDDEPSMPPDAPPIPEAERQVLRNWINSGVLETKGSVAVAPKKVDVAMATPATERPAVQPLPAHLPLEPAVRTGNPDACAALATSPWAPLVAVCGQKQILLHRTNTLDLAGVLPFPEGRPHVVRFSAGGGLVIAGGGVGAQSGKVAVWNLKNGRRIRTLGDELDVVLAADISPDQRLVALGGPQKVVRLWSLETGAKLHDLGKHTDWILATAFSPDGRLLASADRAGNVILWEAATGRDFVTPPAHPSAVTSLAWRGDSGLLATGCEDGQIRLWETENGTLVKAWPAHGGGVTAIDFTRDGRLVSVGRDKTPKLWNADGSQERAFEACADVGLAVSYCDETNRLVVGDWTGELRVFNAADGPRIGTLDPNPPALAERVAAAQSALTDRQAKLDAAIAALNAAPDAEKPKAETAVIDLKNQMAQAAAAQAKWLGEVAFQASYEQLAKAIADREQKLAAAESDLAGVDAKRQSDDQARQAITAKRDGMQKQAESLSAALAQTEQQVKELTALVEKQKAEIATLQAGLPAVVAESEAAVKNLAESARVADEKRAAVAARQTEAAAAARELNALQGLSN